MAQSPSITQGDFILDWSRNIVLLSLCVVLVVHVCVLQGRR